MWTAGKLYRPAVYSAERANFSLALWLQSDEQQRTQNVPYVPYVTPCLFNQLL